MSAIDRNIYIHYRLQRAKEALEEALILSEKQRWNAVVNRLYYACFYGVIALLLTRGIETTTHDGARIQFGLHFVKSGQIEKKQGWLFSKLFDFRQKGDYGDMFDFDEETAKPLIVQVDSFITIIEEMINLQLEGNE
jgi:uncharacterized protein (UPF0332 family)